MNHRDYFAMQATVANLTQLVLDLPLKDLEEQMKVARLVAPVLDQKLFDKEDQNLKIYQELTASLREYQEAARLILRRYGVNL